MKISLEPQIDIKYDYLNENESISKLQKAHSIYTVNVKSSDWRDQVYFAREEIKLSLDLLLKTQKEEIRLTEIDNVEKDFDLKRLLHVKEQDLLKIISKFSTKITELQQQLKMQEKWSQWVQEVKKRNWIIGKFNRFFLDFGFKKIGSNLDYKVQVDKDLEIHLEKYYPLGLSLDNKTSSNVTDLVSREDGVFKEIEEANFGVLDQEIMGILTRGDLEEEFKSLKKGNSWILKEYKVLQIQKMDQMDNDGWLNVLVILLRYRMLKVYKRNFRNRGIASDYKSSASLLMIPVIEAYADYITKIRVGHILDDFYRQNSRILDYSVSVEYTNNINTWKIFLFSRYSNYAENRWNILIIYDSKADQLTLKAQEYVWPCSLSNLYTLLMREIGRLCLCFAVYEFQRFAHVSVTKGSLDHSYSIEMELRKSFKSNDTLHLTISLGMYSLMIENKDTGLKEELFITSNGDEQVHFKHSLREYILLILS